jgi:hypothetical protein
MPKQDLSSRHFQHKISKVCEAAWTTMKRLIRETDYLVLPILKARGFHCHPWSVYRFLLQERNSLGGRTGLEILRKGIVEYTVGPHAPSAEVISPEHLAAFAASGQLRFA